MSYLQILFDLTLLSFLFAAAYRWYELEQEWREAKHPFLKEQNEELKAWFSKPMARIKRMKTDSDGYESLSDYER